MTTGHGRSGQSTPPFGRAGTWCSRAGGRPTAAGRHGTPRRSRSTCRAPGRWKRRLAITEVSLPYVSFRFTYRFLADGTVLTSDSTLCFREPDELEASLVIAGFRALDVRDAPDRPGRELVFIAGRAS